MYKEYLLFLLLGHILGDFYTQTENIAKKKKNSVKWVFIHSILYFVTVTVVSIPVISIYILILDVVSSFLHAMIDMIKYLLLREKKTYSSQVFIIDQCLHLICLIFLAYIWTKRSIQLEELRFVKEFFDITNISEILICDWILGLLIIHKPANILIQNLIGVYKPKQDNIVITADSKAGRMIGTIERVIMLMLIWLKQYSAIGLVLTAKSIARYDRIAKDEKFAEYYLLGTLLSAAIVIVCATFLF